MCPVKVSGHFIDLLGIVAAPRELLVIERVAREEKTCVYMNR